MKLNNKHSCRCDLSKNNSTFRLTADRLNKTYSFLPHISFTFQKTNCEVKEKLGKSNNGFWKKE